jgi:hypothetical protein
MRARVALLSALAVVVIGSGVGFADPDPGWSFSCTGSNEGTAECPTGADQLGQPVDYPAPDEGFPPVPGFFVAAFVLMLALGVGSAVLRYRAGSRIPERAGLNPEDAGMTSLLSENGLPAAYVMSNLPGRAAPAGRSVEERLAELTQLRDRGVISAEEYARARAAVLDDA